jgi:hypothetical protein
MRRLEHIAAGVEHDVRQLFIVRGRPAARPLAEPLQRVVAELQMRQDADVLAHAAEALHAELAALARLGALRHGEPSHREQEARVDAVVAGLDAFAAQHAGLGPALRLLPAFAQPHYVQHAGHHRLRIGFAQARRARDRTGGEARTARGAGVEHVVDATVEGGLET